MVKRFFYLAGMVALVVGLLFAPACDDSDNGGGGPTPGTTASMTGTWDIYLVLGPGASLRSKITVDQSGKVTSYIPVWWHCGGMIKCNRLDGSFTQLVGTIQYGCPGKPASAIWTDKFTLYTVHADRLEGSVVTWFRSQPLFGKWPVILHRR